MSGKPSSTALIRQLWFQVLLAMLGGVLLGRLGGEAAVGAVGWMGVVFVRALKMVIAPLVFCSVLGGVASVGQGRDLGRLGLRTLAWYLMTSLSAILVGQLMVNLIQPGKGLAIEGLTGGQGVSLPPVEQGSFLLDLLLRFLPLNPVRALVEGDMLGIIGFSILLGIGVTQAPEALGRRVRGGVDALLAALLALTGLILKATPLGVLGLIASASVSADGATVRALLAYVFTLASGLALHGLVVLPLLLWGISRRNPLRYAQAVRDALLTAFSTASSSATLPITLRSVESAGVPRQTAGFVLPLGATVNMDGTALYECVAVIFIAQILGVPLGAGQQALVVVTALAASIGAAGIPSAGLVMIYIVLEAVGLRGIKVDMIVGTMLAIDRPLDMLRTTVNVWSDACGAAAVSAMGSRDLGAAEAGFGA